MIQTRITDMLGIQYPIIQAPMGWIARSALASAVSNAGGMGIIETSSGDLPAVREEIQKMKGLTDKPFGVNIAQAYVRDPDIVSFVVDQGVKFVTTSAGNRASGTVPIRSVASRFVKPPPLPMNEPDIVLAQLGAVTTPTNRFEPLHAWCAFSSATFVERRASAKAPVS